MWGELDPLTDEHAPADAAAEKAEKAVKAPAVPGALAEEPADPIEGEEEELVEVDALVLDESAMAGAEVADSQDVE